MGCLAHLLTKTPGVGIPLPSTNSFTFSMYADDTVVALTSWDHYSHLHSTLDRYTSASGAKFNTIKTEVLSRGGVGAHPPELPQPTASGLTIRHLGVPVGWDLKTDVVWDNLLLSVKTALASLRLSQLSIHGRIIALRTLVLPKFLFLARFVPVTKSRLSAIDSTIASAVWQGGRPKVNKLVLGLPIDKGGFNLPVFSVLFESYYLIEIRRFMTSPDAR
ncbi:hypothetical protein BD560DRAFT_342958, partial [Blakeslea trispora]